MSSFMHRSYLLKLEDSIWIENKVFANRPRFAQIMECVLMLMEIYYEENDPKTHAYTNCYGKLLHVWVWMRISVPKMSRNSDYVSPGVFFCCKIYLRFYLFEFMGPILFLWNWRLAFCMHAQCTLSNQNTHFTNRITPRYDTMRYDKNRK